MLPHPSQEVLNINIYRRTRPNLAVRTEKQEMAGSLGACFWIVNRLCSHTVVFCKAVLSIPPDSLRSLKRQDWPQSAYQGCHWAGWVSSHLTCQEQSRSQCYESQWEKHPEITINMVLSSPTKAHSARTAKSNSTHVSEGAGQTSNLTGQQGRGLGKEYRMAQHLWRWLDYIQPVVDNPFGPIIS